MGRNITLVGTRLCWSDALLYCRDSHWDLLSLIGPEDQEMVDKLVARAPFPLTSHLWVGLRRYRAGRLNVYQASSPHDHLVVHHFVLGNTMKITKAKYLARRCTLKRCCNP